MKILIATRLEPATYQTLKTLADRRDRTVAYLVRQAVERFVTAESKKGRKHDPCSGLSRSIGGGG